MSGRTRVERRSWLSCSCGRIFLGRGALNAHAKRCEVARAAEPDGPAPCYHPRSCLKCQRRGSACGAHLVGESGHEHCTGRVVEPDDEGNES